MTEQTYKFTIPIGDWSDDGHGKCQYFQFSSNLPLEEVREAYFVALEKHKDISPESFAHKYQDSELPAKIIEDSKKLGCIVFQDEDGSDIEYLDREMMADYVAWFCTLGNTTLKLERMEELDMLPFYGVDEKRRHIGFIGYGLFE